MGKKNTVSNIGFKIETIEKNGFRFNPIALVSLKKAVKSFYGTYQGMNRHVIVRDECEENEKYYPNDYFECYLDSIIYFHHFFEITIKDLLENGNVLLSRIFNNKDMCKILYDLANGNKINSSILDEIKTVEFSEALERFKATESVLYPDGSFAFLSSKNCLECLKQLNDYRNRILHKGHLIFKFTELDKFIGGSLFPIIKEIFKHHYYKDYKKRWYNKQLSCKIDVFDEIINECTLNSPNHRKIAVLKEMGRAAYLIPVFCESKSQKMIDTTASVLSGCPYKYINSYLDKCPVCGRNSVISFEENEDGESWVNSVKCLNCSFELYAVYIGDMNDLNLNIHNYFK